MISQHQYQVVCDELDEARDRIEELEAHNLGLTKTLVEFEQENVELSDLAQMIVDAESADPHARLAMYYAWLYRAKQLKEQS